MSRDAQFPLALPELASHVVNDCQLAHKLEVTFFEGECYPYQFPSNPSLFLTDADDLEKQVKTNAHFFTNQLWKVVQSLWHQLVIRDWPFFKIVDYDYIFILYDEVCLVQRGKAELKEADYDPNNTDPSLRRCLYLQLESPIDDKGLSFRSLLNIRDLSLVLYGTIFGIILCRNLKSQ